MTEPLKDQDIAQIQFLTLFNRHGPEPEEHVQGFVPVDQGIGTGRHVFNLEIACFRIALGRVESTRCQGRLRVGIVQTDPGITHRFSRKIALKGRGS